MSLDITFGYPVPDHPDPDFVHEVFSANITHNLTRMADWAGIYKCLWRPEEIGITKAGQLIAPLESGLHELVAFPKDASKHEAPNGWGTYQVFVRFARKVLQAARAHPDALVVVSR